LGAFKILAALLPRVIAPPRVPAEIGIGQHSLCGFVPPNSKLHVSTSHSYSKEYQNRVIEELNLPFDMPYTSNPL
jgi:hypothetical protein